jgi:hypothetical protein
MKMKNKLIIEFLIVISINCFIAHDITNEEEQKNIVYVDSLFLKYGQSNNTMYSYELKLFLKSFFHSMINEIENESNNTVQKYLNCIKSKGNAFINIASHLKDDILINGTNFSKLSSLLIANMDTCFNPTYSNQNKSLNNSSHNYNHENSVLRLFNLNTIKNNFFSISKEGKSKEILFLVFKYLFNFQ